ncbi:MAG: type secretion system major pseudopilin GspG [Planctomycetota bacterium]|jgi:prepilin-type N-terminal cleavage/methylation domain-containing protein
MTTCDRNRASSGFTLVELVIVLGVLGILVGAAAPLAGAAIDAARRQEVNDELRDLGTALESHYFERGAFPALLDDASFLGVHLQPGVRNGAIVDPFAAGSGYRYRLDAVADTASVYSIGDNRRDENGGGDDLAVVVHGAAPGMRRTSQKLRIVVERLAMHLEAGGPVTGSWDSLVTTLGLGAEYRHDGWGRAFAWDSATFSLRSSGPDRRFGTADDITL